MALGSAMLAIQFAAALLPLLEQLHGSVTSWRRTVQHNAAVGGVPGSSHTHGLGADVVWDRAPDLATLREQARQVGLHVIREANHDHFQPLDWRAPQAP